MTQVRRLVTGGTRSFVAMSLRTGILIGFLVNHNDPTPYVFHKCLLGPAVLRFELSVKIKPYLLSLSLCGDPIMGVSAFLSFVFSTSEAKHLSFNSRRPRA